MPIDLRTPVMNEMPPKSRAMDPERDVFYGWAVYFELSRKRALRWDHGRGIPARNIKLDGAEVVHMHEGLVEFVRLNVR
jgi:hypothetical protein